MRKKASTLLTLSAIALLLLAASPMLLLNVLLQPAQAQTTLTFSTSEPALGTLCTGPREGADITFAGQGTFSDPQHAKITSGTFQVTNSSGGQILYSGSIKAGSFVNGTGGGVLLIYGDPNRFPDAPHSCSALGDTLSIDTSCNTFEDNEIDVTGRSVEDFGDFNGAVECSSSDSQGGGNTASSMTGTAHDSDGDGIHDSSDRCPNNSNHRCFKEG